MRKILLTIALLSAACGREDRPEPPTPAESQRLNEAEAMLNDLAKEEGAVPEGTAPVENIN